MYYYYYYLRRWTTSNTTMSTQVLTIKHFFTQQFSTRHLSSYVCEYHPHLLDKIMPSKVVQTTDLGKCCCFLLLAPVPFQVVEQLAVALSNMTNGKDKWNYIPIDFHDCCSLKSWGWNELRIRQESFTHQKQTHHLSKLQWGTFYYFTLVFAFFAKSKVTNLLCIFHTLVFTSLLMQTTYMKQGSK